MWTVDGYITRKKEAAYITMQPLVYEIEQLLSR